MKKPTAISIFWSAVSACPSPASAPTSGNRWPPAKRKHARRFERVGPGFYYFRPLLDWTEAEVFRFLEEQGIPPNPLYARLGRVGCAPCNYANKRDLRSLFASDPAIVERIRDWEARVSACSKTGQATFFHGKELSGAHLGEVHPLTFWRRHRIDAIRHWAQKPTRFVNDDWQDFESACSSDFGLCE